MWISIPLRWLNIEKKTKKTPIRSSPVIPPQYYTQKSFQTLYPHNQWPFFIKAALVHHRNTLPIRPAALADSFSISSVPPQDPGESGDQLPGCADVATMMASDFFFVRPTFLY
jgi:hypothetical protein